MSEKDAYLAGYKQATLDFTEVLSSETNIIFPEMPPTPPYEYNETDVAHATERYKEWSTDGA